MNIVIFKDGVIHEQIHDFVLFVPDVKQDIAQSLTEKFAITHTASLQDDAITAVLADDYAYLTAQERANTYLLLTADDSVNVNTDIRDVLKMVVYVSDFKDGRVFSLIRQIRQVNTPATILVAGQFGLDQANYFYKSGATGFVVTDDKLPTLRQTLVDLQSAYDGQSVSALPMFR